MNSRSGVTVLDKFTTWYEALSSYFCAIPFTPRLAWGIYREQRSAGRHKECHMYTRGGRRAIVEAYRLSYWGTLVLSPQPSSSDKHGLHPRKLRYAYRFRANCL